MPNQIIGVGKYIPLQKINNLFFEEHIFFNETGELIEQENSVIVSKLKDITGIEERRYADKLEVTSDLGYQAAKDAINDAKIDLETIDYIIFAHNFGDVKFNTLQSDMVPSLAARVKHLLNIKNPYCVAFDILFGCPGWIEAVILANIY